MKILKFKEQIRFQIESVVMFEFAWNLRGRFLSGKFEKGRTLRVTPDERWFDVQVVELPGTELNEIRPWVGQETHRSRNRRKSGPFPTYGDELFVFPLTSQRFSFDEVRIITKSKSPKREREKAEKRPFINRCFRCGKRMKRRFGMNGVFFGCSQYPKCTGTFDVPSDRLMDVED